MNRSSRPSLRAARPLALLCALVLPTVVGAQEEAGDSDSAATEVPGPEVDAPPPQIDLDRLLNLPESYAVSGERRGGATAGEWRDRFARAREELDDAERGLRRTQKELENLSEQGGDYQVSAPGSQASSNSPVHFGLRQDLRRYRDLVEQEQHQLRELTIQADLANVPEGWRQPAEASE